MRKKDFQKTHSGVFCKRSSLEYRSSEKVSHRGSDPRYNRHFRCVLIFFLFFLSTVSLFSETNNPWKLCTEITWDAGMRFGAEYSLTPRMTLKADAGSTLFSLEDNFTLTFDLFAVRKLLNRQNGFQVDLMAGLPYNMVVFGVDSAMFSCGVSLDTGYQWKNGIGLYVRTGGGYPIFEDEGVWSFGNGTNIFWPDLAIELKFRM